MRIWREFRISREGRRGFLLILPVFEDTDAPEDAARMNRFYRTASEDLYAAALDAIGGDARRIFYRCDADVAETDAGTRVTLSLSLSVSGERTRRKTITHLWRDGVLLSREASPIL
ncbi:MAG: hypothetical protein K6A33_04795 [Clostridiales bacterium]|nr:hypothetical protein [Clostridiales bacterium]